MTELPAVALADRVAQLAQKSDTRFRNADADDAAVVGRSIALDEAALFQSVK
jgi:hypothetical protein